MTRRYEDYLGMKKEILALDRLSASMELSQSMRAQQSSLTNYVRRMEEVKPSWKRVFDLEQTIEQQEKRIQELEKSVFAHRED